MARGDGNRDRSGTARLDPAREALLDTVEALIARHLTVPATGAPLRPYAEQRMAARVLLRGNIAEMATGEGKTIAAALAAAVLAQERRDRLTAAGVPGPGGVHIATANAYLAGRDAGLLRPVYAALGLTTGTVTPDATADVRREAYRRDIVYGPLAEFGFDYLRDRLVLRAADRVQGSAPAALIVDEADLLLIDEARTPLVIAREREDDPAAVADLARLAPIVQTLVALQVERVTEKARSLRTGGVRGFDARVVAAQLLGGGPHQEETLALFAARPRAVRDAERTQRELRGAAAWMLEDGLLYRLDEEARTVYLTAEGQAAVEERLGPLFADPATAPETLATLHNLLLAFTLFERDRDYVLRDGRVVLVEPATGRPGEGRRYLHGLQAAIEVKELGSPEAETETLARVSVQQFVRWYPFRAGLTGTARTAARELRDLYGMDVVPIPRHRPDRRIDRAPRLFRSGAEADRAAVAVAAAAHQLGRPVLIGTRDVARSERLSALLDARAVPHAVLNAREQEREAVIIAGAGRSGAMTVATSMAGRGTDIVPEPDLERMLVERAVAAIGAADGPVTVHCDSAHAAAALSAALAPGATRAGLTVTVAAGTAAGQGVGTTMRFGLGLLVLAVGPGPDRRIDDQLRGRAGRQGDEGTTRLFAALDDETVRFYADAGRLAGAHAALARAAAAAGATPPFVEGRRAARLIDDAQGRAARIHAGQRRHLFEFDQVLEAQRQAMLDAYERGLAHPAPDTEVEGFIPLVAADEAAIAPLMPESRAVWRAEVTARYGLPAEGAEGAAWWDAGTDIGPGRMAGALAAALRERWQRGRAEAGTAWPSLARAALLRAAAELWSVHVDRVAHLQGQAPALFAHLPGPAAVPYAIEASARYEDYVRSVRAATLAALLTLPQPYERALPFAGPLSDAATAVLALADRSGANVAQGTGGAAPGHA